jgi:hypothetical protein
LESLSEFARNTQKTIEHPEAEKRKAKENQRQSQGQGKKGLAKLSDLKLVSTRAECAKAAGVEERTPARRGIHRQNHPSLRASDTVAGRKWLHLGKIPSPETLATGNDQNLAGSYVG